MFRSDLLHKEPVAVTVPHKKVMLCLNESSFNPYELFKEDIASKLHQVPINRYFNDITYELRTKISTYAGVNSDQLLCGNGADEMLYYCFVATRELPDDFALALAPSYFDYKSYSSAVGLNCRFVDLDENFDFDADTYLKTTQKEQCKIAILCNPNNPTGNLFDSDKLEYVIKNCTKPIILDETYYEFSGITFADKLDKYPHLIIIRSFSKSFSAAGLRFGYMMAQRETIAQLKKVMTAFNLSLVTQAIATVFLDNKDIFRKKIDETIGRRDYLYRHLSEYSNIKVHNTATNFLPFSIGNLSDDFFEYLNSKDIAIRAIGAHPLLKNYLRISIGSEKEIKLFLAILDDFMSQYAKN